MRNRISSSKPWKYPKKMSKTPALGCYATSGDFRGRRKRTFNGIWFVHLCAFFFAFVLFSYRYRFVVLQLTDMSIYRLPMPDAILTGRGKIWRPGPRLRMKLIRLLPINDDSNNDSSHSMTRPNPFFCSLVPKNVNVSSGK